MKTTWSIGDSIDLEYFAALDQDTPYQTLRERDRQVVEEVSGAAKEQALAAWLQARRREAGRATPGEIFTSALGVVRLFLALFGLIFGFAAGWGFFIYLGQAPVNVLYFFVVFLLPQWFFLLLAVVALLPGHGFGLYPPLQLAGTLLRYCYTAAWKKLFNCLGAEKRLRLTAFASQGRLFAGRLGKVFFWLAVSLTQIFACAINIGVLASALLKIAVTDLAFGWQSTMAFSAEKLFAAVRFLALPWSWLWPEGVGHPSLVQIVGSHIVLKEGIVRLQSEDLVSWWPFLLLCLVAYGLLPRLVLWLFCRWQGRRALAQSLSRMPEADELWQRMRSPLVTTAGLPDTGGEIAITMPATPRKERPESAPARPALLLVPAELQPDLPKDAITDWLARQGLSLTALRPIPAEYGAQLALPAAVAEEMKTLAPAAALCLLAESWLPPIASFMELLRQLRQAIGSEGQIILLLIGKGKNGESTPAPAPPSSALVPPDDPVMVTVWRQKLAALADPALRLLPFAAEDS
ncbi:MAG: DUF2868 domain-containing protein [Desulfobulbaceae bacterium]|jgi:hypothetical protein|nr:DUF2868 domain-containing protein [Desulfobulbaceae bacterium]